MEYDIAKLWAVAWRYSILQLKAIPRKNVPNEAWGTMPNCHWKDIGCYKSMQMICTNQTKFINNINHNLGLVYNSSGSPSTGFCNKLCLEPPRPQISMFQRVLPKVVWLFCTLELYSNIEFWGYSGAVFDRKGLNMSSIYGSKWNLHKHGFYTLDYKWMNPYLSSFIKTRTYSMKSTKNAPPSHPKTQDRTVKSSKLDL